jgi:hypothetical protein
MEFTNKEVLSSLLTDVMMQKKLFVVFQVKGGQ